MTLILDYQHPSDILFPNRQAQYGREEKFQFSHRQCGGSLDSLINYICTVKNLIRGEDMRLVLAPDFIVLDLDCIEEGDRIIVKSL